MTDTQLTTHNSFGSCLRYLRHRARLTQRDLGVAVGYSEAQIARLEREERLPNPTVVSAQFVSALGLEDDPEAGRYLLQLAHEAHGDPVLPAPSLNINSSLPRPFTTMIGRKSELAAISSRLLRSGNRLVNLTGPPGVGKTRLALAIAERLQARFRGGVFFISLAPINDADLVADAVALGLGMIQPANSPPRLQIATFLAPRQALLILDNFEQVSAAAPLLSQWLSDCPELRLLVTSREPLRLSGEQVISVPPLALPAPELLSAPIDLATLSHIPAIALFVARATAACSDFRLTHANAADICEMCRRLDGLPLAIELVAARVNAFAPRELLSRLTAHDSRSLETGLAARDMPPRHRSLKDAIGWSYELLSAEEKQLFRYAGVFSGGFTAETVLTVGAASEKHRLSEKECWLQSLVDKNLLRPAPIDDDADAARFGMLELIRTFALEQLDAAGELINARNQHAAYFLSFGQVFEQEVRGHSQLSYLKQAEINLNNIREALEWTLSSGDIVATSQIASSFRYLWHWRGHNREGFRWVTRILDANKELPPVEQARVLNAAAATGIYEHEYSYTLPFCERALEQAYLSGDAFEIGQELGNLSIQLTMNGDAVKGMHYAKLAMQHAQTTTSVWLQADALFKLGVAQQYMGPHQDGLMQLECARQMMIKIGDRLYAAIVTDYIGSALIEQRKYDAAQPYFEQVLTVFRQDAELTYVFNALVYQGECHATHGLWQKTALLCGAVEQIAQQCGVLYLCMPQQVTYDFILKNSPLLPDRETFNTAWMKGRAMSLDQAVACALEKG